MKFSKSFGQVFLKDKTYVKKTIDALDIEGKTVVEIGPGSGAITSWLLPKVSKLYCIELDPRFHKLLSERYKDNTKIKVICQDILKFDFTGLKEKVVIYGNVPYDISNKLIQWLVKNRDQIETAYLTVQKEFADKLIADTSRKEYGFLSCFVQYYANLKKCFEIPRRAFVPVPKVDSAFIKMQFYTQLPVCAADEKHLFLLIRKAFNSRRKKLSNSLKLNHEQVDKLISQGIDPQLRPQEISIADYVILSDLGIARK